MIKLLILFLFTIGTCCANAQNSLNGELTPSQHAQSNGTDESVSGRRQGAVQGEQPPSPRRARRKENEHALPAVVFQDAHGRSSHTDKLRLNGNWILIVLDSSMPSAKKFLLALAAKKDTFDDRTTILLIGSDATIENLSSEKARLPGVRWIHANQPGVIKELDLNALPSMMGMRSDQKIAWKFSGLHNSPGGAASMIRGWLRLTPASGTLDQ